jgi:hypothetical protein
LVLLKFHLLGVSGRVLGIVEDCGYVSCMQVFF